MDFTKVNLMIISQKTKLNLFERVCVRVFLFLVDENNIYDIEHGNQACYRGLIHEEITIFTNKINLFTSSIIFNDSHITNVL